MSNRISRWPQPISPLGGEPRTPRQVRREESRDFAAILNQESQKLKFSRHALERIQNRNIPISASRMNLLKDAVRRAAEKGAQESLILFDEVAYVVSVKNSTVITAIDSDSLDEHIFTNIDSAVVIR